MRGKEDKIRQELLVIVINRPASNTLYSRWPVTKMDNPDDVVPRYLNSFLGLLASILTDCSAHALLCLTLRPE